MPADPDVPAELPTLAEIVAAVAVGTMTEAKALELIDDHIRIAVNAATGW